MSDGNADSTGTVETVTETLCDGLVTDAEGSETVDGAADAKTDAAPEATTDPKSDATPEPAPAPFVPAVDYSQRPELIVREVGDEGSLLATIAAIENEVNAVGDPEAEKRKYGGTISRRKQELETFVAAERRAIGDLEAHYAHLVTASDAKHRRLNELRDQLADANRRLNDTRVEKAKRAEAAKAAAMKG